MPYSLKTNFPVLGLLALLVWAGGLSAQHELSGRVLNPEGGELAFANILVGATADRGTTADDQGYYQLRFDRAGPIELEVSYVGYVTRRVSVDIALAQQQLDIVLQPTGFDLSEAVVLAGENPAHRLIRAAIANRERNDPENYATYECRRYTKLVVSLLGDTTAFAEYFAEKDTSKRRWAQAHERISGLLDASKDRDLFLIESVSDRFREAPDLQTEHVVYNRVSGFKEASFSPLTNGMYPFGFYQPTVAFTDDSYLNPISPGSTNRYFFDWNDTLYTGRDTIFVIDFRPMQGKNFTALRGRLHLHSAGYAIQEVWAEPADTTMVQMSLHQKYRRFDGEHWFPERIDVTLGLPKYPTPYLGSRMRITSRISSVRIGEPIPEHVFADKLVVTMSDSAGRVPVDTLAYYRGDTLLRRERATYVFMDSLGARHKLDKRLQQFETLVEGRWPLGKLEVLLGEVFGMNDFEGVRLGLGLVTSERISERFEVAGFLGYGFGDGRWKYGGRLYYELYSRKESELRISYRNDLLEPAQPDFPFLQNVVGQRFFARRMDNTATSRIELASFLTRYLQVSAALKHQLREPLYDYRYRPGTDDEETEFSLAEMTLSLQYAYGRQYTRVLGNKLPTATPYPVLTLGYGRGLTGIYGSDYAYHRALAAVDHEFKSPRFGQTSYRLEAGYMSPQAPLPILFSSSGMGNGFQPFILKNAFQTMRPYEFLANRFAHVFLSHDFGTLLFRAGRFRPEIVLEQHVGWSDLARPELHEGVEFRTMGRGYFESGLVVKKMLRFNYFNALYLGIGAGVYYRYGPYALPDAADNLAFRLAVSFSM